MRKCSPKRDAGDKMSGSVGFENPADGAPSRGFSNSTDPGQKFLYTSSYAPGTNSTYEETRRVRVGGHRLGRPNLTLKYQLKVRLIFARGIPEILSQNLLVSVVFFLMHTLSHRGDRRVEVDR